METDVRATADGIAVLAHDKTLKRVFGDRRKISEISLAELRLLKPLAGGHVATLAEALLKFPQARFNLDIKESAAITPTVVTIEEHSAHQRVLVSSFSNRRRLRALRMFSQSVATSASASVIVRAYVYNQLGLAMDTILQGIGAVQIPTKMYGMNFKDSWFIRNVQETKTLVHFWTINSEEEINDLLELGADGIVTDETELAVKCVDNF